VGFDGPVWAAGWGRREFPAWTIEPHPLRRHFSSLTRDAVTVVARSYCAVQYAVDPGYGCCMSFESPREFREVMDKVFGIMSTDAEMGPALREAETPQRFEFPDVDMVVNITYAEDGGEQNLRWEWSDDVGWEPEVGMVMNSDIANRYFQGKENVAMAIARRRIKTSGDVKKALALIPKTKPVFAQYREMLERDYPHLVE
jgi:hypothetical protein